MHSTIALLSAFAGATAAADVVSFVFPGGYDGPSPVASITAVKPSTTAFRLACPSSVSAEDCGWGTGMDYTIVSGTSFQASLAAEDYTLSLGCLYNTQATQLTCTADMSDEERQTAVLSGTDVAFITASVVQGASLLSGSATASAGSAASSVRATASATPGGSSLRTTASATGSAALSTAAVSVASGTRASGQSSTPTTSGVSGQQTGAAAHYGLETSVLLSLAGAAALLAL